MRRHALTTAVRAALPPRSRARSLKFLALLDRRLRVLEGLSGGHGSGTALAEGESERALVRSFLRPRTGAWDDGDENLVRGYLDRWIRPGDDPVRARARALSTAARALAGIEARPGTLWFFLWEMESVIGGLRRAAGAAARRNRTRPRP